MEYCLAIDIGASSGRHILGWLDDGKLYTEEIYRFSNLPTQKTDGFGRECLTWDTERLFSEIVKGLQKAKELGKIPKTVGWILGESITFCWMKTIV